MQEFHIATSSIRLVCCEKSREPEPAVPLVDLQHRREGSKGTRLMTCSASRGHDSESISEECGDLSLESMMKVSFMMTAYSALSC